MLDKGLKLSFVSRAIVTLVELAFALICFPYAARVLKPESIGEVDYVNSSLLYFFTISIFGISEYGLREVAKYKYSRKKLAVVLTQIFKVRFYLCSLVTFAYVGLYVPFFIGGGKLFYISGFVLFGSLFNFVWALEGLERFTSLAYYRILSKVGLGVCLFLFVKNESDVVLYFVINSLSDFAYYIFSFIRLKLDVPFKFRLFDGLKREDYTLLRRLATVFITVFLQSTIMLVPTLIMGKLGYLKELGIYTVSNRFFWMGFYALMPIYSVLISRTMGLVNDEGRKTLHLDNTLLLTLGLSMPISFGLSSVSSNLILSLVGNEYAESILVLEILSFLILIISLNNFFSMQVLFSYRKEGLLKKVNFLGLVVMLFSSLIAIPMYKEYGILISLFATYFSITFVYFLKSRVFYKSTAINYEIVKLFICSIIMWGVVKYLSLPIQGYLLLAIKVILGVAVYVTTLFLFKSRLIKFIRS